MTTDNLPTWATCQACGDRLTQAEEGRLDAAVLEYAEGMFN